MTLLIDDPLSARTDTMRTIETMTNLARSQIVPGHHQ
jgi:hypothetical protein